MVTLSGVTSLETVQVWVPRPIVGLRVHDVPGVPLALCMSPQSPDKVGKIKSFEYHRKFTEQMVII